ncbi:MAG: hypothetical protein QNK11_07920 [Legionella sp.]|nr:hypothetical protein [Legionella sp.]
MPGLVDLLEKNNDDTASIKYSSTRSGKLHVGRNSHEAKQIVAKGECFLEEQDSGQSEITTVTNYTDFENFQKDFLPILEKLEAHFKKRGVTFAETVTAMQDEPFAIFSKLATEPRASEEETYTETTSCTRFTSSYLVTQHGFFGAPEHQKEEAKSSNYSAAPAA